MDAATAFTTPPTPPTPPHDARGRSLRARLHHVIWDHDTPSARAFDVALIVAILLSVAVVTLDSVASLASRHGVAFQVAEWTFTVLFTLEYVARVWTHPRPGKYARSFFGLVDLLAVLPTYLTAVFPPSRFLIAFRILRVLRVFRIFKLAQYVSEASVLTSALRASRYKITVFVSTVLTVVVAVGALMYLIEGKDAGFTSIPTGIYWAIVTLTTVGYGDIAPETVLGRFVASALMVLGYGIIAVPTGIVTMELDRAARRAGANQPAGASRSCRRCRLDLHDADARHCKRCGERL
jgi:voltage-gated potassium channel